MSPDETNTAAKLAGIRVQDADGAAVTLGSLWAHRTVVLVFVRHFG